jgi:[citrate (pro-3S)-lyase] ligase
MKVRVLSRAFKEESMGYDYFQQFCGNPFWGNALEELQLFLRQEGLSYEAGIEFTVILRAAGDRIAATGSLAGKVVKCVAVAGEYRQTGLTARILSVIINYAATQGKSHLFLFTKPENQQLFENLAFYPVVQTDGVLFMENRKNGVQKFVASLENRPCAGMIGAIVANCNPFTKGHLYLIEQAASQCALLHLFLLSEDRSAFPAQVRYLLAKEGTAHLFNVLVHPTADYLISATTFPTYFIKNKEKAGEINCRLDLAIFCECIAKPLGITIRFVGDEPFCPVTRAYNLRLKEYLPEYGVKVVEVPRREVGGEAISASRVRTLMALNRYDQIIPLVPEITYQFLLSQQGRAIQSQLKNGYFS